MIWLWLFISLSALKASQSVFVHFCDFDFRSKSDPPMHHFSFAISPFVSVATVTDVITVFFLITMIAMIKSIALIIAIVLIAAITMIALIIFIAVVATATMILAVEVMAMIR